MFKIQRRSALALVLAAGAAAFVPQGAAAQDIILDLDRDGPRVRVGEPDEGRVVRRRDDDCGPERALDKAERFGVRRARIDRVGRRTIEVRGRLDGERVTVTIGRSRGCPILDY